MNTNSLLDVSEQLYTGKVLVLVHSFFNILVNLFAIYALMALSLPIFALLAAIVFAFNALFFFVAFKNWKKVPEINYPLDSRLLK